MYSNLYAMEKIVAARLNELRRERAQIALLDSVRPRRRGIGRRLGVALVRIGQRLAQGAQLDPMPPPGQYRAR